MCEKSLVRVWCVGCRGSSVQPFGASFFVSSGANLTLRDVNISPRYIQRNPTFVVIVPQIDESEQQESGAARLLNNNQLRVQTVFLIRRVVFTWKPYRCFSEIVMRLKLEEQKGWGDLKCPYIEQHRLLFYFTICSRNPNWTCSKWWVIHYSRCDSVHASDEAQLEAGRDFLPDAGETFTVWACFFYSTSCLTL